VASLLVRAMPHVAYIMNQLSGPSNHGRWRLMARASRPLPSAFRTAMVSEPVQVKHRLQELHGHTHAIRGWTHFDMHLRFGGLAHSNRGLMHRGWG